MNKINLGVFSELANNKADRDLRNVDLNKTDIIIEYQEPTAENDYTWYRLYASGWCEQGGRVTSGSGGIIVNLHVTMADVYYNIAYAQGATDNDYDEGTDTIKTDSLTTTSFQLNKYASGATSYWQVSGKADMTGHEIIPSKAEQEEFEHRVIEFQKPTAENSYTWYRKYADGWVEQGGTCTTPNYQTIALPIAMENKNYSVQITSRRDSTTNTGDQNDQVLYANCTTSSIYVYINNNTNNGIYWQVSGMYATEE